MAKFASRASELKGLSLPLRLAIYNYKVVPVHGYISQLALPPFNICRIELTAIPKALGFGGNSMRCKTVYSLQGLLGFTPMRPSVYTESCMRRGAIKASVDFGSMHVSLGSTAESNSSN
jgi:hypothetical protein